VHLLVYFCNFPAVNCPSPASLVHAADLPGHRRSSTSQLLQVPAHRLATVTFFYLKAADLSYKKFRQLLKTFLFGQ